MRALVLSRLEPGLDDGAIVGALARRKVETVYLDDEKYVYPRWNNSRSLRFARRIVRNSARKNYNEQLRSIASFMKPDVLLIFGGNGLDQSSVAYCKSMNIRVIFIYPDMTFNLPRAFPELWKEAECYTTKPNWRDLAEIFGVQASPSFIYPWYDPQFSGAYPSSSDEFDADILFVGHASPKKTAAIRTLIEAFSAKYRLRLIGSGWESFAKYAEVSRGPMYGSFVNGMYRRARVTMGLLEDLGAGVVDLITARSIQAPAYGGCLVHPRNPASIDLFGDQEFLYEPDLAGNGLAQAVQRALADHPRRTEWARIQAAAVRPHSVDNVLSGILTKDL